MLLSSASLFIAALLAGSAVAQSSIAARLIVLN